MELILDMRPLRYIPEYNCFTGGVKATLLFCQCYYWWDKNEGQKFYKFRDKCNHNLYKIGDSWCEELRFTGTEFDDAIKKIGFKLGKGKNIIKKEEALIIYYTDSNRLTWYDVNYELFQKKLNETKEAILKEKPYLQTNGDSRLLNNPENLNYVIQETQISKFRKPKLHKDRDYHTLPGDNNKVPKPLVKEEKKKPPLIKFNYETRKWENIRKEDCADWHMIFPDCNIDVELIKMKQWLLDNDDRPKKNFRSFITNWLENDKLQEKEKAKRELEELPESDFVDLRKEIPGL